MEFRQYKPSDALKPYVRHYYTFRSDDATAFSDTVFPSGDMEMIFNLGDGVWQSADRFPPFELWGQITKPLPISSSGKHMMLGVKFFPHSAAYFLPEDINRFNDQVTDLSAVLPAVKSLHQQLLETPATAARITLLEAFLLKQLNRNDKIDKVGNMMASIFSGDALTEIASDHNITPRYLHKLTSQYTGLSPKEYNKITRFQRSLQLLGKNDQHLTAIAYDCGYFDQSHFIRDFKSFTGLTPSSYLDKISPVNQLLLQ
jgi:AraC-like DNA-binding protein